MINAVHCHSIIQVVGQWKLGLYVCLLWTGSDVVLSTTSIMHLCAIALYRYSGIAHPLRMRSTQEMRHVVALVAPSWLIAVTLSIPFAIQGAFDSSHVLLSLPGHRGGGVACGIFNRTFAIYSSLVSFFIPLMIMIFADIRSIQILRNNVVLGLPVQTGNSSKRSRRRRTSAETEVEDNFSTTEIREQSPLRRDPSTADEDRGRVGGGKCAMAPRPTIHHKFNPSEKNLLPHASRMSLPSDVMMQQITNNQTGSDRFRQADTPYVFRGTQSARPKSVIYISMLTSGRGRVKTNSRERRAERTLIWVFVAFVALWLPFFCVNLTYGLCAHCSIPDGLFALFTWLGYFSSGVNPCIYTYLNKDFRNAFKNILTCKRFGPTRFPRQYS